jgi:hypothetical protein
MKAHGTRLILGLIAATVIAVDEQVLHPHDMSPAGGPTSPGYDGSDGLSPVWTLAVRRWFAMYVAFENEHAVFDTNERREVAPIPADQPPRAIVYPAGTAAGSEENRAPRVNQPVIRLTATKGDAESGR